MTTPVHSDALSLRPDPEVERLREQVRELLADVELLERGDDPPSVTRTARRLRHDWITDAFVQRKRANEAEARVRHLERALLSGRLGSSSEVVE